MSKQARPRAKPEPPPSRSSTRARARALLRKPRRPGPSCAPTATPPTTSPNTTPARPSRALVGTRGGSTDGYDQQVFFFVDGRFIGTDAKEPSASVKVVSQSDTEAVAVTYRLYRPGDPLSSPSGGQVLVHFQLNNGMLVPVGTIPPVHSSSAPSRLLGRRSRPLAAPGAGRESPAG